MTDSQVHGDEASRGMTEHHRSLDFQKVAKRCDVVGPLL
jgi:hypothetical protein